MSKQFMNTSWSYKLTFFCKFSELTFLLYAMMQCLHKEDLSMQGWKILECLFFIML